MTDSRYVFEGIEVKLTGRTASKQTATTSRRTGKQTQTVEKKVEITPANGDDGSWKKWVDENQLFTIDEEKQK